MKTVEVYEPASIFNAASAQEFTDWVSRSLQTGVKTLLINLHHVEFMDSGGLGGLAIALKYVRQGEARMVLCSLSRQLEMLLELSSMEQFFEIYPSLEEFERTERSSERAQ